jgi:hypothetical protein
MAGEWLKFECSLPEKPETMAITVAMGWDDTDLTVGKLMRLFRWFDQQTIDGNAHGVTPALLDKLIGVTGFVQAVANAGWLTVSSAGLALHNFDRHNGATAKSRAQTAKRVANHRAEHQSDQPLGGCNAPTVTPPLAREEKRREESKEIESRATRLPKDWEPEPEPEAERGISRLVELPKFRDYWSAKAGKDARKTNWQATWRNWARNARRSPADVVRMTVAGSDAPDPALQKIVADAAKAVPMPEHLRKRAAA